MFDNELKMLKKYEHGLDLDPEDDLIVRELCLIGLMKTGMSLRRRVVTARTTNLGLKLL